jgi:signal transduction histidine kinase
MVLILAERSRIARELHDTLIQGFSGVTMEMQALTAQLPESAPRGVLQEIIRDAGHCLREARRSVAGLRSGGTGRVGTDLSASISQAARHLTEARDVRLRLDLTDSPGEVGAEAEYNLLRIMSEAVGNAVKHANPRSIEVSLDRTKDELRLAIRDDGSGFDAANGHGAVAGHYGLIGMKERATQLGGKLSVESAPGKGTTVVAIVPAGAGKPHSVTENRNAKGHEV